MVSGPCEAIGSPFGFRNVIAGLICVMTVFCMGSMTSAVFALTRCPVEEDSWRLEADCFEGVLSTVLDADVVVFA